MRANARSPCGRGLHCGPVSWPYVNAVVRIDALLHAHSLSMRLIPVPAWRYLVLKSFHLAVGSFADTSLVN